MNNHLKIKFIKSLNEHKAISLCNHLGIFFTMQEMKTILPYIKDNIENILNNSYQKEKIHADLHFLDMNCLRKIDILAKKLNL